MPSLIALLQKRRQTLAVAESCTGGLVSHLLTETPGSSRVFRGGVVAYDNAVKRRLLGISPFLLRRKGAVSREVALEMARGARRRLGASIGLAITGIAGPGGGTRQKPVGLVYVALAAPRRAQAREFRFSGSRSKVKLRSARAALGLLQRYLTNDLSIGGARFNVRKSRSKN